MLRYFSMHKSYYSCHYVMHKQYINSDMLTLSSVIFIVLFVTANSLMHSIPNKHDGIPVGIHTCNQLPRKHFPSVQEQKNCSSSRPETWHFSVKIHCYAKNVLTWITITFWNDLSRENWTHTHVWRWKAR